jgi:hypothetical protein
MRAAEEIFIIWGKILDKFQYDGIINYYNSGSEKK